MPTTAFRTPRSPAADPAVAAAEAVPHLVWVAGPDGEALHLNRRCRQFLGLEDTPRGWDWRTAVHPDDLPGVAADWAAVLRGGGEFHAEFRLRRHDGAYLWHAVRAAAVRDDAGAVARWVGTWTDVDGRRRADDVLRASEARLRALVEHSFDAVAVVDAGGAVTYAAPAVRAVLGYDPAGFVGRSAFDFVHPDDLGEQEGRMRHLLAGPGAGVSGCNRYRHADGTWRWLETRATSLLHDPAVGGIVVNFRDVTDRKAAADAVRASEARFRALVENGYDAVEVLAADGTIAYAAPSVVRVGGRAPAEVVGRNALEWCHPDDVAGLGDRFAGFAREPGACLTGEYRFRHKDGTWRWAEATLTNLLHDPAVGGIVVNVRDVTDRKAAADALRRTTDLLTAVADGTTDAVFVKDADGRYLFCNPACLRFLGRPAAEVLGRTDADLFDPAGAAHVRDRDRRVMEAGATETGEEVLTAGGATRTFLATKAPYRDAGGSVVGVVGVSRDITDRVRAEAEVRAWKARYEAAVKATGQVLYDWDTGTGHVDWGGNCEGALGYAPAELPADLPGFVALVHPDDRGPFAREVERVVATGDPFRLEYRVRRQDGAYVVVADQGHFLRGPDGRVDRMVGFLVDVTAARRLEEQYRQAQKMEAVGRLAGGVAHDFNNLLTVINGYADVLLGALPAADPAREMVAEVRDSGERAAGLTRQLLAFSRQQILQRRVLDLNAVVADITKMLGRVIGEDIALTVRPGPRLRRVEADPGQVGQVVMNLCVNARDAMPTGGALTVSTRNVDLARRLAQDGSEVTPGPYVELSVSDTGCGMTEDVRAHVFEPFFTTKAVGQGTGLGLATVYGIVKQSGGHVEVETAVGRGTTFRVLLPAVGGDSADDRAVPAEAPPPGGRETVLVVEDEPGVRGLTRLVLQRLGYAVLEAGGGDEAVAVARGCGRGVDLLLTDVVMPGAGGPAVADRLRGEHPGLRVVYMSGYTDDAVVRHGVEADRVDFVQKPFKPADLARKVREVLDRRG